jgi:GNAT superfamily N-acetyltransferase
MAADLAALPPTAAPSGLAIERVGNGDALREWAQVAAGTFGEPKSVRQARIAAHEALGLGADLPLQRFVARLAGEPVATSMLYLGAGVAGIYDVATVPAARRQGIGAAVTLAALHAARAAGYRVGVLESSSMGLHVYERLGFRSLCVFSLYLCDLAPE